jgi:hypothetical protein
MSAVAEAVEHKEVSVRARSGSAPTSANGSEETLILRRESSERPYRYVRNKIFVV